MSAHVPVSFHIFTVPLVHICIRAVHQSLMLTTMWPPIGHYSPLLLGLWLLPYLTHAHIHTHMHTYTHTHIHILTEPTTFTKSLDAEFMLSIQLGTEDTLFCEVSSDSGSILSFSWVKDGQPLMVDSPRVTYLDPTLTRNGNIRITNVMNSDAGQYRCVVTTVYNDLPAPAISTMLTEVVVTGMLN